MRVSDGMDVGFVPGRDAVRMFSEILKIGTPKRHMASAERDYSEQLDL